VIAALHANVLTVAFRIHTPTDAPRTGDPRPMFSYLASYRLCDYPVSWIRGLYFGF
jgi:hypothetical protein